MKILRSFLAVACGICILFTIACVALFGGAVWLAFSFLVPMQNPVPRFCGFGFYLLHAVVFQGILGIRFNYSGTPIRPADSGDAFIVISNHPPLQLLFAVPACFWGVVNTYAAVIKKEFLQFPLFWLGWPSVLAGMAVPIDRGDKSAAYEAISKYAERLPFGKRPFAVILFPDGSRPTPEKIVGSWEKSVKRFPEMFGGVSQFTHTLVPKPGGLFQLIGAMRAANRCGKVRVINMTFGTQVPQWKLSDLPKIVGTYVLVETHEVTSEIDACKDIVALQSWLLREYARKQVVLADFQR